MSEVQTAISRLADGTGLSEKEAESCMLEIMQGKATDAQIAVY